VPVQPVERKLAAIFAADIRYSRCGTPGDRVCVDISNLGPWILQTYSLCLASYTRKRRQERVDHPQQVVEDYGFRDIGIAPTLQSLGFISQHCKSGYSDDRNALASRLF
jgi:hypothetical protein